MSNLWDGSTLLVDDLITGSDVHRTQRFPVSQFRKVRPKASKQRWTRTRWTSSKAGPVCAAAAWADTQNCWPSGPCSCFYKPFYMKSAFRNVYSLVHLCFKLICAPHQEGLSECVYGFREGAWEVGGFKWVSKTNTEMMNLNNTCWTVF